MLTIHGVRSQYRSTLAVLSIKKKSTLAVQTQGAGVLPLPSMLYAGISLEGFFFPFYFAFLNKLHKDKFPSYPCLFYVISL
jgi:hypothetical protein